MTKQDIALLKRVDEFMFQAISVLSRVRDRATGEEQEALEECVGTMVDAQTELETLTKVAEKRVL